MVKISVLDGAESCVLRWNLMAQVNGLSGHNICLFAPDNDALVILEYDLNVTACGLRRFRRSRCTRQEP